MKAITTRLLQAILIICIVIAFGSPSFALKTSGENSKHWNFVFSSEENSNHGDITFTPSKKNSQHGNIGLLRLRTAGRKRPKKKDISPAKLKSGKGVGSIAWSEITGGPKHIRGPLTANGMYLKMK